LAAGDIIRVNLNTGLRRVGGRGGNRPPESERCASGAAEPASRMET